MHKNPTEFSFSDVLDWAKSVDGTIVRCPSRLVRLGKDAEQTPS